MDIPDLNFSPPHGQEDHVQDQEEPVQDQEEPVEDQEEHAGVVHRKKQDLPNTHRYSVYVALKTLSNYKPIEKADKEKLAQLLKTSLRTVERIWKQALDQIEKGEEVDVSIKKKGICGRKRKNLGLSRVSLIPLNKRSTLRALARSLDIPYSTLQSRFKWGEIKRVTSSLKPRLKPENKIRRVGFSLSMVDPTTLEMAMPSFGDMHDIVHMDEKWFEMTKRDRTYYLTEEEKVPTRTIQNKNSIGKVMFLTALARPRFNEEGECTFDGKIGMWAFIEETVAKRNSKNRDKGTKELKTVIVTRDVMRSYLCEKVIPAIAAVWPVDNEIIYIQQDNARTHVLPDDDIFQEAVAESGLDIMLIQQPPNSPDMNVLDLCFFRYIQSLTLESAPNTLQELILSVEEAFDRYDVLKLDRAFITLQTVLIEVMKQEGGNEFAPPLMNKEKLQRGGGQLPMVLRIDGELIQKSLQLIAQFVPDVH